MPISASNKQRYPKDWPALAKSIKDRAGWRCEGSPKYPDCRAAHDKAHPVTGARVVLTVGHLDHQPENCAGENLKAWCQRCHNTYDQAHPRVNAAATRRAAKADDDLFARAGEP